MHERGKNMGFILEDRMPDGIKPNGWYAGRNEKYYDMFNLTANKNSAYIFQDKGVAMKKANYLNKCGWNFTILQI